MLGNHIVGEAVRGASAFIPAVIHCKDSGKWIEDRTPLVGKVACPHRIGRNVRGLLEVSELPQDLDAAQEEQFVFDDGSAERRAELISDERIVLAFRIPRGGIEFSVSVEFENCAVKLICPRFGGDNDLRGSAAVLRPIDAGLHLELAQGV